MIKKHLNFSFQFFWLTCYYNSSKNVELKKKKFSLGIQIKSDTYMNVKLHLLN